MRRTPTATAIGVVVALFGALLWIAPAGAQQPQQFVDLINAERGANGLAPLAVDGSLTAGAQGWSQHMAERGSLSHDSGIGGSVGGWTKLGENVGMGGDVGIIWGAFMGSSQHRTNILDPEFTHVGVGIVVDLNNQLWVTQRFMRSGSGSTAPPPVAVSPPPAPSPAPVPAPAPRVRATPVAPPTTTPPTTAPPVVDEPTSPPPASAGRVAIVLDALHQLDR